MGVGGFWAGKLELGWVGGRGGVILVKGFFVYNRVGDFALSC